MASWFDARTRTVVGLPVAVAPLAWTASAPRFAVSETGTLVTAAPAGDAVHVVLHWAGDLRRLVPPPQPALPR